MSSFTSSAVGVLTYLLPLHTLSSKVDIFINVTQRMAAHVYKERIPSPSAKSLNSLCLSVPAENGVIFIYSLGLASPQPENWKMFEPVLG